MVRSRQHGKLPSASHMHLDHERERGRGGERGRGRTTVHGKPSFVWQALLILFPVIVLAVVGFISLRRDRVLVQHEAAERAKTIADNLLPNLWAALTNISGAEEFWHHAFQIDGAGRLLFPPVVPPSPTPQPLNPEELRSKQAVLWQKAVRAETEGQYASTEVQAWREFLVGKPAERFAAVASYNLGVLLAKRGEAEAAREAFQAVLDNYPHFAAESGFSLERLAEFNLLKLSAMETNGPPKKIVVSPDDFCRSIILEPSSLTSPFLNWISAHASAVGCKDGNEKWNHIWREHEECRGLYTSARSNLTSDAASAVRQGNGAPEIFWFKNEGQNVLAIRFDYTQVPTGSKLEASNTSAIRQRTETSHNEPEGLHPSRSGKSFYGGGSPSRNVMSLEFDTRAADSTTARASNHWFLCRTESEISQKLFSVLGTTGPIPEYFGIGIELAGKRLLDAAPELRMWRELGFFEGGGGRGRKIYFPTVATNVLASAGQLENESEQLRVNVYLTSPAALFKRQSNRTFWFGSLVTTSALAAFVGLFAAWRAFNRQQELADMKSNFVSSVSHELRAPIASVRLMAESLERGTVSEPRKQHEYFRFIGQECRRLSSLIENVLDFSRIEQGRKQYEFEPTDLLALVQQTVKLMESYGAERQVSFALKVPDHQLSTFDYQLSLDGRAIQQALINLIDNAIKHSPNGQTVTVELSVPEKSTARSFVNLSVQDNGPGIPPEEREKIFERFYRLGSELRRETAGVGIGLSIVKHIVEAHGGRVVVESAPGKGSRFTIELPVTERSN